MANKRTVASALSEIDKRLDTDDILTLEVREQIKQKARDHVAAKRREKVEAKLLAEEIRREEVAHNPFEQTEEVLINIAPYVASKMNNSSFISLDGTMYFHGLSYSVPYSVARTLEDVMARTWEHEREIHGERRRSDVARRPISPQLRVGQENLPASALNTRQSILGSI